MPSPVKLREFRFRTTTTFGTSYTAANDATWNIVGGSATKLAITDYDDSGLVHEGLPDETLQTRFYTQSVMIEGNKTGTFKVSSYLGGAYSNVTAHPQATILSCFMGGLASPTTTRSGNIGANSTATNINITGIEGFVVAGQAVLLGTKGDGAGNGEVKPIKTVGTNWIELGMACAAAPATSSGYRLSTTAFYDEDATQQYINTLVIGHAAADQRQTIMCAGTATVESMGVGELPKLVMNFMPVDHQYVPTAQLDAFETTASPEGNYIPFDKSVGAFQMSDFASTTRAVYKVGNVNFDPRIVYEPIPSHTGVNGIGGWQKMPSTPRMECTLLFDEDMRGLLDDWEAQTAKQIIFQVGHLANAVCCIEIPKAYIDAAPVPTALNNLAGVRLVVHGTESATSGTDLIRSPCRIHWF